MEIEVLVVRRFITRYILLLTDECLQVNLSRSGLTNSSNLLNNITNSLNALHAIPCREICLCDANVQVLILLDVRKMNASFYTMV